MEPNFLNSKFRFFLSNWKMVCSQCRLVRFPFNLNPYLYSCISSSSIPLHSLILLCLRRHLGFACHYLLDSESSNSDELEHDLLRPATGKKFFAIGHSSGYPNCQLSSENSVERKYSFDRKWCNKDNLMKRITFALSKQGWDLNFHTYFGIELDSSCFPRMLNDLFDECLDSGLVYYFFRKSRVWFDKLENKLQIYSTMVHVAVSGNMNHIAMNLLREIVRSMHTVEGGPNFIFHALWQARRNRDELETVYSMLVICYAEQAMLDVATELITRMEKFGLYPSNGVYVAVGFLLKSHFTEKAESDRDLFVKLQSWGARLTGFTLSLLIREFCAHGCLDDACKLLYDMPTFGAKADIVCYTILIDALCKRGYVKEATSLLFKIIQIGVSPDSTLISSLVHGYCKIGSLEAAMSLLNFSFCVLDAFMYNSFIFAYCQYGDVERAHALLNAMFDLNIVPDSTNYTTVIKGYCRLYRLNHALKTFTQMIKRGIEPTIVTYTVLVEGHCKNDDIQGAEFIFNSLKRDGLHADVITYNTLISGYCKKGHMHRAYELVDMMKKDGFCPDSVTYNMILHGLIKRGFPIKTIFSELVWRGYSPDVIYSPDKITCTNIIHGYSLEGKLEEAYLIWCSMSRRGMTPDVVTCSALLNGFCKRQCMQDADILFHKMLDAGLEPDLILLNTLIRGFCSVGDINRAHQLLIMMKASGIFPNDVTYRALVTGFEKRGVENAIERAVIFLQKTFLMK